MTIGKRFGWGLALGVVLLAGGSAHADFVTYATVGTFGSSGTSTYTNGSVSIVYNNGSGINVNVSPTSLVSFGTFNTSATTSPSPVPVSDTFTLKIFQASPTSGNATFVGSLTGTLATDASTAFVRFDAPLSRAIGNEIYTILSADNSTPGRVNISPPRANNGVSTIAGQITAVPEPSALALVAIGGSALLGLGSRGRRLATMNPQA